MHTQALPKSVLCIELGPHWPFAHYELAHLIKKKLLGDFFDHEARSVTPALRQDLQVLLSERCAGWSVYGSASWDGEETANYLTHGRILLGASALG